MQKVELQPDEICRYRSELQATVAVVCKSSSFRTSAKSCQFLRFIVQRTLGGKVDELKERVIGIELLGREASYDTGSDAGVRVRANDVRKRLAAYYAATTTGLEYTVDIPQARMCRAFMFPACYRTVRAIPSFLLLWNRRLLVLRCCKRRNSRYYSCPCRHWLRSFFA